MLAVEIISERINTNVIGRSTLFFPVVALENDMILSGVDKESH